MFFLRKSSQALPPAAVPFARAPLGVEALESRLVPYAVSGNAWPNPQLITLSFVPDGTNLGGVQSNLFATFNARWAQSMWQAQILKAAQLWAQQANLNFTVIADSGADIGSGSYEQGDPTMGDIRIGGYNLGSNTLAAAFLPPPSNNYSIAGDLEFNTAQPYNIGSTYDLFTVAVHEIGHALGMDHSSNSYAVMYATYTGKKTALNSDDIAGIRSIYGTRPADRFDAAASNGSFATATNLNSAIDAASLTAAVNGLDITTTSDVDYYTFTAPQGTSGSLTVTAQSAGLSLLAPTLTVYAADQKTVLGSVSGAGHYGTILTLTLSNITAGQQFYVKVAGADTSAFGTGAYALTLNFGTGPSPTIASPNTQTAASSSPSASGGQPNQGTVVEGLVGTVNVLLGGLTGGALELLLVPAQVPSATGTQPSAAPAGTGVPTVTGEAVLSMPQLGSVAPGFFTKGPDVAGLTAAAPGTMAVQHPGFAASPSPLARGADFGPAGSNLPKAESTRGAESGRDLGEEHQDQEGWMKNGPKSAADGVAPRLDTEGDTTDSAEWEQAWDAYLRDSDATRFSEVPAAAVPLPQENVPVPALAPLAGLAALAHGCWQGRPAASHRRRRPEGMAPSGQQRRWPRRSCGIWAWWRRLGEVGCLRQFALARNISAGGIHLLLEQPLTVGAGLAIEIVAQSAEPVGQLLARVVHVRQDPTGGWLVGCAFDRALQEEQLRAVLEDLVAATAE